MKKLILLSALLLNLLLYSQEIKISIKEEKIIGNKSSSIGEKVIEYNNYLLFDVISDITQTPFNHIKIENDIKNITISFKAVSNTRINKKNLINVFKLKLREKFKLNIYLTEEEINTKVIYCFDYSKMESCNENIVETMVINRTFKAKCVSTDILVKQIVNWFGMPIFNKLDKSKKYNFTIHHANSFEELAEELYFFYSIDIIEEKRNINIINIQKL